MNVRKYFIILMRVRLVWKIKCWKIKIECEKFKFKLFFTACTVKQTAKLTCNPCNLSSRADNLSSKASWRDDISETISYTVFDVYVGWWKQKRAKRRKKEEIRVRKKSCKQKKNILHDGINRFTSISLFWHWRRWRTCKNSHL